MVLAACGGDTGGGDDVGSAGGEVQNASQDASGNSGDASSGGGDDAASGGSSQAVATLTIGDETHVFEGNQWTDCEIGGGFLAARAEFQQDESKQSGDWFQFLDREDGGINFSAVIDGEEYSGTGGGDADEITSNGFTYTGPMNRSGERLDTVLEVSCS